MPEGGLVRGVSWNVDGPSLSVTMDDGDSSVPLTAGQWLRFRIRAGDGVPPRYCLGYVSVAGAAQSQHIPCPSGLSAERGFQCGSCFARDDLRHMHDFHRSGYAPAGMRDYLAQPHWLYIATFADGTTKVGTASQLSKWRRLAEQGAVVAQYVALARDGAVVRLLEDSVTNGLGLTQFVRAAAKLASLLSPLPIAELEAGNQAAAGVVREFLQNHGLEGFEVVRERWEPSSFAHALTAGGPRVGYPQPLDRGTHGMRIESMLGPCALVAVDDSEVSFVVDLAGLKGRKILFGDYTTEVPALQESLF
ncbi:DUF2797 domain-containing protein [Arthrobacter sp. HLT1-20]